MTPEKDDLASCLAALRDLPDAERSEGTGQGQRRDDCPQPPDLILVAFGQAAPEVTAQVERHAAECACCRLALQSLKAMAAGEPAPELAEAGDDPVARWVDGAECPEPSALGPRRARTESKKYITLKDAYQFAARKGLTGQADRIRRMHVPKRSGNSSLVRKGYFLALFEEHGLLEEFLQEHWPWGRTPQGEKKRRRYLHCKELHEKRVGDQSAKDGTREDAGGSEEQGFGLEADLRDFLANNLHIVEPGLRLYAADGRSGVEFPVDDGRIDILAVDRNDGLVVFELKLSRGRNKAIGQLLYYMGWVDKHLGRGQPCRGVIIARQITEDLVLATRRAVGVSLFQYKVSVSLERVEG